MCPLIQRNRMKGPLPRIVETQPFIFAYRRWLCCSYSLYRPSVSFNEHNILKSAVQQTLLNWNRNFILCTEYLHILWGHLYFSRDQFYISDMTILQITPSTSVVIIKTNTARPIVLYKTVRIKYSIEKILNKNSLLTTAQ